MSDTRYICPHSSRPTWRRDRRKNDALADLFSRRPLHYRAREHLFLEGDSCEGVFLILSGTVIVYTMTLNGQRQIQNFAGAGELLALNFSGNHTTSAQALTDVTVGILPRLAFNQALQTSDRFRRTIFERIDEMLDAARRQAMLLGCKGALEKTATFLLDLENGGEGSQGQFIPIPMSRCDIADFLGLTLETVSRMLGRLKRQDIIDLPRADCFRIKDPKRLAQIAGLETDFGHMCGNPDRF